jgi:hypothetical protein
MKYIVVFCIFCNTNYSLQIYYLIIQVPQSLCASYLIHTVGGDIDPAARIYFRLILSAFLKVNNERCFGREKCESAHKNANRRKVL